MQKLFTKNILWYVIAAVLAIHMLNVPLVIKPYLVDKGPTWLGLDVSWQMALNYVSIKHLLWGKDIIYTYGPLGFLSYRYGWGVPLWVFTSFDLFVVINFFFVFKDFILNSVNKFIAVLILFGTTILVNTFYGSDISLVVLFFIYYWLFKTYKTPRLFYFIVIGILCIISFYIKLNTGLFGFLFLFIHLVLLLLIKKIRLIKVALISSIIVVLFILSLWILNVSLLPYIEYAFELINGYNNIMYLLEDHKKIEHLLLILFFLAFLLFVCHSIYLIRKKNYYLLFFSIINIFYIYLLKKQSFLRNDIQHLSEFIVCFPLIFIYGNLLFIDVKLQKYVSVSIFFIISTSLFFSNNFRQYNVALIDRYTTVYKYFNEIMEYKNVQYLDQSGKRFIPERVLKKIDQKSVDIFPWDCEYLLENKLNYTIRPIFQSHVPFTTNLEKSNYNFYANKAPEFVLYDYDGIDNRYPFNDELLVNLFLIRNYVLADTFTSNERWRALLQKKEKTLPVILNKKQEIEVNTDDEISSGGFPILKMYVEYNIRGMLKSFWNIPYPISIQFLKDDGHWATYKTSSELLKGGIYLDKLILNNRDFVSLLSPMDSLPKINKVKLLIDMRYFKPKMKIQYFNVK